ncbi:MAG: hypothetical protein GAK38_02740 [Xylophilus sp.]|nr:MAG: hypothetical protein GAK38_02740 [Xylophilus sp.]
MDRAHGLPFLLCGPGPLRPIARAASVVPMPHTILLIDADAKRALAVAQALTAARQDGPELCTAASLEAACTHIAQGGVDLVVCARLLPDGAARSLAPRLGGLPAIVLVEPGREAEAADAMHAGFSDYAVCDAAGSYLAVLPTQAKAAFERARAHGTLLRQHALLEAILHTQAQFITARGDSHAPMRALLPRLLDLTGSAFGFLGEVEHGPDGLPALCVHAITDIAWDGGSRGRHAASAQEGMVFSNLDSLFGAALSTREPVLSNDPAADPRGSGLPPGHPPLTAFLGLPILAGDRLVAMLGLANRPGGYAGADAQFLQPLLGAIGQLVQARRAETANRVTQARLQAATAQLAQKTHALEDTLDSMAQGIIRIGSDDRVQLYNPRLLELLDLSADLMARHPTLREVGQLMIERGDYDGPASMIEPPLRTQLVRELATGEGHLPEDYVRRTPGGRVLQVHTRRTADGGRVRTFTDVTARHDSEHALRIATAEIERLAYYDELTGLPNRRQLQTLLADAVRRAAEAGVHGAPPRPASTARCCTWTSTTSRASTTRSATAAATSCWPRWRSASRRRSMRRPRWGGPAATSSPSSSTACTRRRRRPRPKPRRSRRPSSPH